MIPAAADRALLRDALVAVASSPTMRDWQAYLAAVEAERPERATQRPLVEQTSTLLAHTRDVPAALPWHDGRIAHARLVSGLVSFTDDYDGVPPLEILPVAETRRLLDALRAHRDLDVAAQLAVAIALVPSPLGAALTLHLATRVLSRNRDTRLGLDLPLVERLAIGRAIAAFDGGDSRGGDPLGDAYHYWANVAAGFHAALPGERLERLVVRRLFGAGPQLMRTVRGGLFRRRLFYGDHARIDRIGLRQGTLLGQARAEPARRSSAWYL